MNQKRKDSKTSWVGVCEHCGYRATSNASEEREALKALNSIHREEREDCPGEILIPFDFRCLVMSGHY